jgi:hypothetical protein
MKNILICKLNNGCYESTDFFADQAAEELRKSDCEVTMFECKKDGEAGLEKLFHVPFDAILDFNSKLPRLKVDERPVVDYLNGPVYDWLLDHPLYHHDVLKNIASRHDFHVICLDEGHAEYVRQWYPQVRSVHMMPLGGVEKNDMPWEKKKKDLIFCGTYVDPELIMSCIEKSPEEIRSASLNMIEYLFQHPDSTVEKACRQYYESKECMLKGAAFPLFMQMNFLADTYVRAVYREQAVSLLLKEKIPAKIYGPGWEELAIKIGIDKNCFSGEISYKKSLEIQAEHGIVLNIMPWFKAGAHDRFFTAMSAGSLCLTDSSLYLEKYFREDIDYAGYQLSSMESLPEKAQWLLDHTKQMQEIALSGAEKVRSGHLWKNRMHIFQQILENEKQDTEKI